MYHSILPARATALPRAPASCSRWCGAARQRHTPKHPSASPAPRYRRRRRSRIFPPCKQINIPDIQKDSTGCDGGNVRSHRSGVASSNLLYRLNSGSNVVCQGVCVYPHGRKIMAPLGLLRRSALRCVDRVTLYDDLSSMCAGQKVVK